MKYECLFCTSTLGINKFGKCFSCGRTERENNETLKNAQEHCEHGLLAVNSEIPNIPEKIQDEICKWIQRGDEVEVLYIVNKLLNHEFIEQLLAAKEAELKEKYWKQIDKLQNDIAHKNSKEFKYMYVNEKEAFINGLETAKNLFNDL